MTRILAALSILVVASIFAKFAFRAEPLDAAIHSQQQILVDDANRSYRTVIPRSLSRPSPIVFAFHGTGDSTESMARYSQLDRLAAEHGFILVYPAARNGMWRTIDQSQKTMDGNPDVRFFDQLLIHLTGKYEIDMNRIYVVGMSNGASFAQLLATARSQKIAAVVAHSGSKPREIGTSEVAFPILLIVGSEDSASEPMKENANQYKRNGHQVELIFVPGLAHRWSMQHNTTLWNFVSEHSLDTMNEFP